VLSFTSCGGGGSEEAKELLEKILQFVGIPPQVIVNVCQDSNRDGICGGGELFTKVVINKGDSLDDILEKISVTPDGRYFLQTFNPELPIIVELQDNTGKVNFDNGKFTLSFNGFKTKKDDNETKEVSILESMVDANALSKDVADKFKTLTNSEAQKKYYTTLFDDLEININTLRVYDLDRKTAVTATIKEMADETITNQEQANRINSCENNQSCMDSEIKKISDELIITDEEASEIKAQYGKWVKPSRSDCESGGTYNKYNDNECSANWENANSICSAIGGVLPSHETLGAVVTDCGGDFITEQPRDNFDERRDKNIANKSYQVCYEEKGFTSDAYWSATTDESTPSYTLAVSFGDGVDSWDSKTDEHYIRCVRGGQ